MHVAEFLTSFKKGSKKFRKILGYELKEYDILKLTQVNTMARITNTTVPGIERVKNMYSIWGRAYLNNDLRIFLLKYFNNILGLGNRIAHFVANAENRCTFCLITNKPDPVHSGTGLICEMVLVKKLKLEASRHECREQYS